jgi:hypothetical protein
LARDFRGFLPFRVIFIARSILRLLGANLTIPNGVHAITGLPSPIKAPVSTQRTHLAPHLRRLYRPGLALFCTITLSERPQEPYNTNCELCTYDLSNPIKSGLTCRS